VLFLDAARNSFDRHFTKPHRDRRFSEQRHGAPLGWPPDTERPKAATTEGLLGFDGRGRALVVRPWSHVRDRLDLDASSSAIPNADVFSHE
jgi:hypothetical protein